MDVKRKMELLYEWKNRRPEMGLIAITCKSTGEMFVDISTDTQFALTVIGFSCQQTFIRTKGFRNYGSNMVKMDLTMLS